MVSLSMIKMANKLKDKPKTRQDVREAARKPKGAPSGRLANLKKALKRPKKGLAGFKSKVNKPNPLSAGGGKTYVVNGKLVTKEAFLKKKDRRGLVAKERLRNTLRKKRPGMKAENPFMKMKKGGSATKDTHVTKEGKTAKKGLWYNIHQKRKRGGKMRKPGAKGAPTAAAIKRSQGRG
jgi:hypothetical protein